MAKKYVEVSSVEELEKLENIAIKRKYVQVARRMQLVKKGLRQLKDITLPKIKHLLLYNIEELNP